MKLSNKSYDILKWVSTQLIPAIIALVIGLAQFFPAIPSDIIAGVLGLAATFIGAVINTSSKNYWKEIENE